jgi:hypothetical protein
VSIGGKILLDGREVLWYKQNRCILWVFPGDGRFLPVFGAKLMSYGQVGSERRDFHARL